MHLNVETFIPCHWFILITWNGKKGYSIICWTTKYHSVGCWFYLLTLKCSKFLAHLEFKNKESKYYFSGSFPHLSLLMFFGIALVSSYLEFIIIIIIFYFFIFFNYYLNQKMGLRWFHLLVITVINVGSRSCQLPFECRATCFITLKTPFC